jgi:hypothetical protein
MKYRHDVVAKLLVAAEVAADEKEITASLTGPPRWHASADAIASCFIRRRQHHTAAYGYGPVP